MMVPKPGNNENVTNQFVTLLTKLKEFEVIPHHFDETLVDKFLELVDFSDPSMTRILREQLIQHDIFEQTSAYTAVLLRLVAKAKICMHQEPFLTFFQEIPTFLYQSRPPFVVGRVFELCVAALPFQKDLNDVLAWAVNNFSDSLLSYDSGSYKMTVFVRAQVVQLLKCLPLSESLEEHLAVLSEIFGRCPILDSPFVLNSIACVAKEHAPFFEKQWEPEKILSNLLLSYPTGRGLAPEIFEYLSKTLHLSDKVHNLLHNNPCFAVNFWLYYFYRYAKLPEIAVDLVITSCSLEQFCPFIPYFSQQNRLEEALEKIKPYLNNRKKINASSVLRFLETILPIAKDSQIIEILEICHSTIANSPPILRLINTDDRGYLEKCPLLSATITKKMKDVFISDVMNHEWEIIENALEVAECVPSSLAIVEIDDKFLFHENDYVALAALRCAISKNSKHFDVYSKIVKQSIHSQSKLLALEMLGNNYPESREQCLIVLPDALEDDDNENRWAAFQLGKVLFSDSMGKEILEKYVDDYLIGVEVRRLFNLAPSIVSNSISNALENIISGLEMINVDVPDCS